MSLMMIAVIKDNKNTIGYRLIDTDTAATKDVSAIQLQNLIAVGKIKIDNLEVTGGELKGINGGLDRYGIIQNGKVKSQSIVVVEAIKAGDTTAGLRVCDCNGVMKNLRISELANSGLNIANGKIVERDGVKYISSICGEYSVARVENIKKADSNRYALMNKDSLVATFSIKKNGNIEVFEDLNIVGKTPLDMKSIESWIQGRNMISDRKNADAMLRNLGIVDSASFIEKTMCVSLFDSFWIKNASSQKMWKDVSLYNNSFSEYMASFIMSSSVVADKVEGVHLSPEYHTSGSFDRCWFKDSEGNIFMFKAGSFGYLNSGLEPYSEVYANQLEDDLGITHRVKYDLGRVNRRVAGHSNVINSIVTRCGIITNEHKGMVSAYQLGINDYDEMLEYCKKISDKAVEDAIDMLILDCLTVNNDRHMRNVSMLMNNDTQEIIGIAPIYDNNLSLIPGFMMEKDDVVDYTDAMISARGMSFDQLFELCYKTTTRKEEIIDKLNHVANGFEFKHIDADESLFTRQRTEMLSKLVRDRARHFISLVGGTMIDGSEAEKKIKALVAKLNEARRVYEQGTDEIMSNKEYDALYDELLALEKETGIIFKNSPTQNVGYEVVSKLEKEKHDTEMLSLDKTKSVDDLITFLGNKDGILSWKMDGLTVVITYNNGRLVKAVTRGNGEIGEIVTNNALQFINVPKTIKYTGELVLRGEALISYKDFENINSNLPAGVEHYKNPRNLCSGSVRQLDSRITAQRNVRWIVFDAVNIDTKYTKESQYSILENLGFEVVENIKVNRSNIAVAIQAMSSQIKELGIPTDGLVLTYNDVEYGKSLGNTAKFPRHSIAFKWQDEAVETRLTGIEWSASRTGLINPVALFEPVYVEGSTIARASIHNVSIMRSLKLGVGDTITVYKANLIIPQVDSNLTCSNTCKIPDYCPVCGCETEIRIDENSGVETLYCPNDECAAKEIKLYEHFVSRDAMNIEGLSEATLARLLDEGMIEEFADIYKLERYYEVIINMPGFGIKSYEKLINAVNKSRKIKTANLIYAMGIPNVGLQTAKLFAKASGFNIARFAIMSAQELRMVDGVGDTIATSVIQWLYNPSNAKKLFTLVKELEIIKETKSIDNSLAGMVFCCTGAVYQFKSRNELKDLIESKGGKLTGSVTGHTNYLITNDTTSGSTKNKTAQALGVEIISEQQFIDMFCK